MYVLIDRCGIKLMYGVIDKQVHVAVNMPAYELTYVPIRSLATVQVNNVHVGQ
jgi:hypothetical protein